MSESSLKGRLLVATPVIGDPNFERTVVLLLEHNDEGALGLVLNRPTAVSVFEPLPEWDGLAASPPVVFVGGPVEQGAAIGLASVAGEDLDSADGFSPVMGSIGTLDLSRDPHDLGPDIDKVRIFAGYAGWGPEQLEGELGADAWLVLDAVPDDVLSADPDDLWAAVLRRQGGDLQLLSYCPPDPSVN
jgi:putative transcriptional regulator